MKDYRCVTRCAPWVALLLLVFGGAAAHAQTQAPAPGRFTVMADGQEVLDTKTNLVWRRCVEGMKWDGKICGGKPVKYKLSEAKGVAAGATKASGKTWRIPNRDDLTGIIVAPVKKRIIELPRKALVDPAAFPNTPATVFWALRPGYEDNLNAWTVNFGNGHVYGSPGGKYLLRLVRANG